jgi:hypothetical protein
MNASHHYSQTQEPEPRPPQRKAATTAGSGVASPLAPVHVLFIALLFASTGLALSQGPLGDASALAEAGIPALSREWVGDDYARAAGLLAAGKVPLPRLSDETGRLFLQRLTSTENFSFYRNRTLPIEQRLDNLLKLMSGSGTIMKQYATAANKGLDLHREITQQLAFSLRFAAMGVQLIDEFLPTIPKDDKYPVRMDGLKRTNGGLTSIFVGAEMSLSETKFYSPEDLSLLLGAMAETLPVVKKAFPPDYRIELRKKLESRKSAFPRKEDAQSIQRMIDELGT